jgi:hypothetical protein
MKEACAILTRHSFSALPQSISNPSHKRLAMIETTFLNVYCGQGSSRPKVSNDEQ